MNIRKGGTILISILQLFSSPCITGSLFLRDMIVLKLYHFRVSNRYLVNMKEKETNMNQILQQCKYKQVSYIFMEF